MKPILFSLLLLSFPLLLGLSGAFQEKKKPVIGYTDTPVLPNSRWRVHDIDRPRPPVVTPGDCCSSEKCARPPSDAIVLFSGSDLSQWKGKKGGAEWIVRDGYMEVKKGAGDIETRKQFGSCQLHIEWMCPVPPVGHSQERGNSGVFLMGRYEVQILDSYQNITYADGQAGAIYGQYPPLVNASRPPGEWQCYDIVFIAPVFKDGQLVEPAYLTVFHNGVLVQNHRKLLGETVHRKLPEYKPHPEKGPLRLQDHGNPVRFRNIWIRELPQNHE